MIDLKTFSSIDNGKAVDSGKCKVGFVDAEGQGDQDITYDANLVCPILLTSKCVILNWKDSLQKDKILNHLGIMHKAAINVAMEGGLDGKFEHQMKVWILGTHSFNFLCELLYF
jgi:hypothetical protein